MKQIGKIGNTTVAAIVLTALLGVGCLGVYQLYSNEAQKNKELENQLAELTKEEQRSAVMQQVNAQMEEIANEERRISDEQREAAELQTKVAQQERQNADRQRHEAEQERQNALVAEHKAIEASEIAQRARAVAEQQRAEAEQSKRVTDTLSFITLSRSLGNVAMNQLQTGNQDLANLLAYTSYLFTNRYNGDIYNPSVYQALVATSQSKNSWNKHKGVVSSISFYPKDNSRFLTVSTYGEIMEHKTTGDNIKSTTLLNNNEYDFRCVVAANNGDTYVASRHGQVMIFPNTGERMMLTMPKEDILLGITSIGEQLLVIGGHTLNIIDTKSYSVVKSRDLPFHVVYFNRYDYSPILFDDQGKMHIVRALDRLESSKVPYKGQVTAFASSKNQGLKTYGMRDGTIYLERANGKTTKLVGHRSQVTKIKLNGLRIYSSSYDGKLNLWMADQDKIEPITLFTTNSWIMDFTYDNKKQYIWAVDQKGNLTEAYIAVPMMVAKLKNQLKRNFTRDEWDYYVGKNIPYENIMDQ